MRLATITNWAYAVTVALTLASGTTMLLASKAQDRERAAVTSRYELDRVTSTLDEDVILLSGLARQYAISGNAADLTAYRREAVITGPVEERTSHIRDAGAGASELRSLHEALRWTDALRSQQQAAIIARQQGHRDDAVAILFSAEYERELDRIQVSVERFQDRIDQRTDTALKAAIDTSRLWRSVSEVMLATTGLLFLCVLFFIFRQRVLRPVVRLSDVITRLAAQDYETELPQYQQIDEIGDMAQALSLFRENGIERQRLEQERDADRAVRDLLSRMTQRMQSCDTTAELKNVVHRFVPRVVPQLAGRLYLLDTDRNAVVEVCAWLDPLHSRAEFSPLSCWALRRGSPHRVAGDCTDVPCEHVLDESGVLPDSICLPLTSHNGTLGLLYFERRPGIASDGVVRAYLETLAENISLALDNLRLRDTLHDLAMADALTLLANRRQLDAVLATELAEAKAGQAPITCAMIDIDHFKRFNDEHGHDAGDAVLRAVGAMLKHAVREGDRAFRYGGEEFLLLMPGLEGMEAGSRAENIRQQMMALQVSHQGQDLGPVTASIGIASAPQYCSYDNLLQSADAALLRAKRGGRNQVVAAPLPNFDSASGRPPAIGERRRSAR